MLTGSLVCDSRVLLQRLQPRDHRLDPRARLLVLGQQLRALAGQLLLLLAQAAVLVGEALRVRSASSSRRAARRCSWAIGSARSMAAR